MSVKTLLVLSCALVVVFAAPNLDSHSDQDHVTEINCDEENHIINTYKQQHGGISGPKLDGTYKFVMIYDPLYLANNRNTMCLRTEYKEEQGCPDKVFAKSFIDVTVTSTVGEGQDKKQVHKEMTVAEIDEHTEKKSADGSYWHMDGTMRQIVAPQGQQLQDPVSYKGDFNFFHNKDGIVAYSACSVDKSGKGIVLIVSKQDSVTMAELNDQSSIPHKSAVEARTKLEAIAGELYKLKHGKEVTEDEDIDNYIYVTNPKCW